MGRLLAAILILGCDAGPTTVAVELSLALGESTPLSLAVSIYDARGGRVRDHLLPTNQLPGTLIVSGLPAISQKLRIVAHGGALLGATATETRPHQQVRVRIALSSSTADADADQVPDAVDNCPDDANPEQADGDGDGVGDACPGADLSMKLADLASGADLSGADFAAAADLAVALDLAGADLAGADLAEPSCPPDVAFCEDFESGAVSSVRWDITQMNAAINAEATKPHRGGYGVHVHSDAVAAGTTVSGLVAETETFAAGQPAFMAVRLYAWLSPSPPSFSLAVTTQHVAPFADLELNVDNGVLSYWNGVIDQFTVGKLLPSSQWLCIEWWIGTGEMRTFVDGAEVTQLHVMQSTTPGTGPLAEMAFGIEMFQPAQPVAAYDVYLDDIIVDTKAIGCSR